MRSLFPFSATEPVNTSPTTSRNLFRMLSILSRDFSGQGILAHLQLFAAGDSLLSPESNLAPCRRENRLYILSIVVFPSCSDVSHSSCPTALFPTLPLRHVLKSSYTSVNSWTIEKTPVRTSATDAESMGVFPAKRPF